MADDDVIDLEGLGDDDEEENSSESAEASSDEAEKKDEEDKTDEAKGPSTFDHYLASTNQHDEFLAGEDPEFAKSLKALESIPKGDDDSLDDTIELDESLLKTESVGLNNFLAKFEKILMPFYIVSNGFGFISYRVKKVYRQSLDWLKWAAGDGKKVIIAKIKAGFLKVKEPVVYFVGVLKKMRWRGRLLLLILVGISAVLVKYFSKISTGSFLPHTTAQSINSYQEVANRTFIIDFKRGVEAFDSPIRHAQYIVLLRKMMINILSSESSTDNPMGVFEIFVEGTNQEVAVEIKDREVELLDRFQRVVEGMSFDFLRSPDGKKRLKSVSKREFNRVLNKGRAKRVFLKVISLKP